jgi:hypothetical protein
MDFSYGLRSDKQLIKVSEKSSRREGIAFYRNKECGTISKNNPRKERTYEFFNRSWRKKNGMGVALYANSERNKE